MRIAAHPDCQIVAAVLALFPDAARYPPHRRMIEEQRLYDALDDVHEVVVAAHVSQLVCEQHLELLRRQTRERTSGHEDHRTQPADDGGDVDQEWFPQAH